MPRSSNRSRRSDSEPKPLLQIAGYVGGKPEIRSGRDGDEFTSFRVGINRFYDDELEEATRWYSVGVNKPALQDWVQANIRKGTAVVVEGTPSKKDWQGTTQHNMSGYRVGLVDWFVAGSSDDYEDDRDEDDEDL